MPHVIGHQKILDYFNKVLENDSLAHAYFFVGPKDVGKTEVAAWLVGKLFSPPLQGRGRGEDDSSLILPFARGEKKPHPDIDWIKREADKQRITIEQIRNLRGKLRQKPAAGNYKAVVIEEASDMTLEAANALLKTLEEPAGQALLILTASSTRGLPETILSRCVLIRFNRLSRRELKNGLEEAGVRRAEELAVLARGLPGRAMLWATDSSALEDKQRQVRDLLKLLQASLADRLAYVEGLTSSKISAVEQTASIKSLIGTWLEVTRDLGLAVIGQAEAITNTWAINEIDKAKTKMSLNKLLQLRRNLQQSIQFLNRNVNAKLVLGEALLNV